MNNTIFKAEKLLLAYTYPDDEKEPEKEYHVGGFAAEKIMERCSKSSLVSVRIEFEKMRQAFRTVLKEPAPTEPPSSQDKNSNIEDNATVDQTEHTITFDTKPNHNDWLAAARAVCGGALRCTYISPDKLTYRVKAADWHAERRRKTITPSDLTWTVPATLTCTNCEKQWRGWKVLSRNHFENRPYHWDTMYCPDCPPVDDDIWLIDSLGIMVDRPLDFESLLRPVPRAPRTTMEIPDFDLLEDE